MKIGIATPLPKHHYQIVLRIYNLLETHFISVLKKVCLELADTNILGKNLQKKK